MSIDCSISGNKKITFECPWDFDLVLGSIEPYENSLYLFSKSSTWHQLYNPWFMLFAKSDWFLKDVKDEWHSIRENKTIERTITQINVELYERLFEIYSEYQKWPRDIGDENLSSFDLFKYTYMNYVSRIYDYLIIKVSYLDELLIDNITSQAYNISFVHNNYVNIMIYDGTNYTIDGSLIDNTLLEDVSGNWQINFKVIVDDCYEIDSISVNGQYKNLKDPISTGTENVYRITKVTSDLIITITVKEKV